MILATESASEIAQRAAARDAEAADQNAERMAIWQRRYPHDLVDIPACIEPPKWPAKRISIAIAANVTKMRARP
jgi:hypothetical protein